MSQGLTRAAMERKPFVDAHHPLRALYPAPGALHMSSPELVIPVAGVQVLMAVVSGYVVVRALDQAPAWLTGADDAMQ